MATTHALAGLPKDFAALVSASPHPELLLSTDFTVAAASEAYLELLDVGEAAVVGHDIREMLEGSPALASLVSSLETVMQLGTKHWMGHGAFVLLGSERSVQLLDVVNAAVLNADGSVAWVIHSVNEVSDLDRTRETARLANEAALQAAEARLRSILQTVPDAMIIIDERGRIESLSTTAERLFGYTMAEAAGKNIKLFMPEPHRGQHDEYLKRYLRTGEKHIIGIGRIVVGQRKDGTTFPMHLTIGELQSAERHYFTGFIRDLTDQQLTQNRLKELQSEVTHMSRFTALGEMASTLAHEMNQPLTAINNYLRGCHRLLQRMEGELVPALQDALAKAADQALRAGQIIRRLREFVARGDSERRVENLAKLIEDASTLALVGTRENAIAVSFRLDPLADQVLVDRIQIQQVLVNLIRNAVEILMETGGRRELVIETVLLDEATIQVSVADSGAGLAPEVRAHLFQPFVTTKQKGMGLGLSICRTIIEAHGGKIWVDARPHGGTIFRFTLRVPGEAQEEAERGQ
jgi:two-component system, LuxR family, sensor kinase FixL